jgi:hypothetical protein
MGWDAVAPPIGRFRGSSETGCYDGRKEDCDLHLYQLER